MTLSSSLNIFTPTLHPKRILLNQVLTWTCHQPVLSISFLCMFDRRQFLFPIFVDIISSHSLIVGAAGKETNI